MADDFSKGTGPGIVCICGSMRFQQEMLRVAREETWNQKIVVMPHVSKNDMTDEEQWRMDMLHTHKIEMADEVIIVDCTEETADDPYIGLSTRRELDFCHVRRKHVRFRHDEYRRAKVAAR